MQKKQSYDATSSKTRIETCCDLRSEFR